MLDLSVESALFAGGARRVAGVDEAGRGPLAGPVIAAAVVVTPATSVISGVNDSKQLSRRRREQLAAALVSGHTVFALGAASAREVDRLNVRRATALAMQRALRRLPLAADAVVVDGLPVPELGVEHRALVGGDRRCYAVACASILAKTVRDRLMRSLAKRHPAFGWEKNAGYGTPTHRAAIARWGPTRHHRFSFGPVAQRSLFGGLDRSGAEDSGQSPESQIRPEGRAPPRVPD